MLNKSRPNLQFAIVKNDLKKDKEVKREAGKHPPSSNDLIHTFCLCRQN